MKWWAWQTLVFEIILEMWRAGFVLVCGDLVWLRWLDSPRLPLSWGVDLFQPSVCAEVVDLEVPLKLRGSWECLELEAGLYICWAKMFRAAGLQTSLYTCPSFSVGASEFWVSSCRKICCVLAENCLPLNTTKLFWCVLESAYMSWKYRPTLKSCLKTWSLKWELKLFNALW